MPGRLRSLAGRDALRTLRHFGVEVAAIRGNHVKLQRLLTTGEKQTLTIPLHKTLAPGTVRAIFRQACRYVQESELRPWFFTD
jgi:predicted RNA binding protein YcfA (HicA-like mRNA interferase family)